MTASKPSPTLLQAITYAWEFGYVIIIPLVALGIGGRFLDRYFGTDPWFLLVGVLVAIILSSVAVIRKALRIFRDAEQENPPHKPTNTPPDHP